ncbi:MAG: bifunctional glutamate N-acetyltransferase/amino-acid acetyltransferase ArgJ [Nitrospiraceae bacterium]|nr:bifunctional glutamate N-acetyltransferase/amino-acid acetyltransferase ArgJ [Nitrospiraceae bacterium]
MKDLRGGVTAPLGFLAAGVHAGIKKPGIPDLALIVSAEPGPIAGVFTNNRMAAAPVQLDRLHLRHGIGRAIIVNSGNANACTGAQGLADAEEMAGLVARLLKTNVHTVFVGSTGVIGHPLPMSKIRSAFPPLAVRLRRNGGREAAGAILTTDLKIKEAAVSARIGGRTITIGSMAKGSGMIHPDMATMLAYLTTDAAIDRPTLQQALLTAVGSSFNCISVDGDTSTNDTVLCLSNGMARNPPIQAGTDDAAQFQRLLDRICSALAMKICRDGEGVTKVVQVVINGAKSVSDAKQVAKAIGTSCLVKTAFFGEDANWGRIIAAVGRAGIPLDPERIGLAFDGIPVVAGGQGIDGSTERRISRIMRRREFTITVDLGQGSFSARLWTTDLSYDYVKINASYRS